ncbi:MAG TPA: rhamnogalacturonan lyase [Polyangiales bacterium]|nr:rhamnogalacturonan lyase [Polyangiales bacterium]
MHVETGRAARVARIALLLLSAAGFAACSSSAKTLNPVAGDAGAQAGTAGSATAGLGVPESGRSGGQSGSAAGSGAVARAGSSAGGRGGTGAGAAGAAAGADAPTPDAGMPVPQTGCVRPSDEATAPVLEKLSRGVVAVAVDGGVFVSFRLLGTDAADVSFHVYRNGMRATTEAITGATQFVDKPGDRNAKYSVAALTGGQEGERSSEVAVLAQNYVNVPLQTMSGYVPGDASVADLDGDGEYEIVLKQEQTPRDNSQAGETGQTLLEAYELDGKLLWRINLGRNIREGAHYTQFMVYDLDGDGRAEVACKTGDGTVDGAGKVIGDANANHRNADGYVLSGPEFLTVFDGRTGAAIDTVDYVPARGQVSAWGDDYGNRVDRFLAAIAYLDGKRPSLIMTRGYYTRTVLAAWDLRDGKLVQRWVFDSDANGNSKFAGQGNHNLSVADIDGDGKQEIVFGGMAVDDDGKGMWSTGYGHGDALHVSDFDPSLEGLEVFRIQERVDAQGAHLLSAADGKLLFAKATTGEEGPGRGVAADVLASSPGAEMWANGGGVPAQLWNAKGENVGRQPSSCNFVLWWDGDAQRELLDGNHIDKYGTASDMRLLTADGCASNNGTKSTPALSADLFGDFREEVMLRTTDNKSLRIFTSTLPTALRVPTLMHDPQYRVAIAWQNVAYNQPPHPSFSLEKGPPPMPKMNVSCLP